MTSRTAFIWDVWRRRQREDSPARNVSDKLPNHRELVKDSPGHAGFHMAVHAPDVLVGSLLPGAVERVHLVATEAEGGVVSELDEAASRDNANDYPRDYDNRLPADESALDIHACSLGR